MKALCHKDLSSGLPEEAKEYIDRFFTNPHSPPYPEEFLQERESKLSASCKDFETDPFAS